MKVSIGYTVGSSLSIFLILCISMNADLVNGQTVSIANATFAEDLSVLEVVVCFSGNPTVGVVDIMTNQDVIFVSNQLRNAFTVGLSGMEVCQSKPIPVFILSQNIGTELTITLASVVAVDVVNSTYSLQIPGATLYFDGDMYTIEEGDINGNTNVMLDVCQTPSTFFSAASFSLRGSALAGRDYIQPTGPIIIQEQNSCTTLQIDIISDILAEEAETIIVQLQPVSPSRLSATSGTTTVTIFDDDNPMTMNQPPTVQCVAGIYVLVPSLRTSSNVQFNTPQCLDNQQANFDATCTPPSGSLFHDGSRTVNCTCTDSGGLTDSCTFVITVQINQPPAVQCPEDMFVTALPPSTPTAAQFDAPECVDNQQANFLATCTPSSGSSINVGSNIVNCTCTDGEGLAAYCTFIIHVQMYQPPTVQCPADMYVTAPLLSSSATVLFNTPECEDNEQVNFPATCTPSSGSSINVGSNTVTCSCTDVGVLAAACTFNITVQKCLRNVPDEKFGSNCSLPCTCASNAECDSVNGVCFGDVCGASMPTTCDKNNLNVMILPDDLDVDEKREITLECTVNLGTTDVTVTWTNPAGAEVQSGIVRRELTSTLTVLNAGKEDSGTYTCIARLNKPTESVTSRNDSVNINIRVQGAISPGFENLRKASIGDDVTLTCEAFGNPIPTVEWLYKNDTNFSGNTTLTSDTPGTSCCVVTRKLHFTNLKLANNGTYTCKVSVGGNVTDREEVDLFVVDFPEIDNLIPQDISSSSLKFTWEVKDYGNDKITCRGTYYEDGKNNEISQNCEETSCELSNLSPNTEYHFSVVCNNTAGPSNTLRMTSKTLATVPEEVPDLNDADVNSTFITVTLKPVSTENGPISCYEFVVAERSEVRTDPDKDFPFSRVKENSDEGTPYRAIVMDHDKYTAQKTVMIGAEGNQESTCELPGNSRRKRALELVSSQTLTARNDPLESAKNYSIFLRIYVLSTNGEYCYESSSYQSFKTKSDYSTEMPQSPMTGLVVALTVIVFIIIILVLSIAVVVIFRRKSTQTDSAKRQSNTADVSCDNEGLSKSTVYVNEQQTSNVDALSYEPVQNQASGGIKLDQLPRTLPDSKVESSYDYEVTGLPKQNTALPEPPVSKDLEKVIYEEMPDELNYSHALYSQEKAPVPFKVSELPEYIHQRRLGGRNALEMEFMTLPQGQLEPWTEAVKKQNVYKGRNPDVLPYDSSRVKLVFDSINHSDYYNASFVMDQHNRHSFIAAESPSQDTADAFLWMIWQEKVDIVVMVSDMNDSAEQTCSPYWPMKEGTSRHYGKMSVALKGIKNYPDYSVRELLIMKKGEDSISVTQFHYHSWPYRRVAEHPTSLLDYIKDVKLCLKRKHFPLLVHCSDGAGATGTFIGLFCLLDELTQSSEVSIYHFVQKMRKTRINMVGTKAQYVFIYDVLLLAYQTPVTVYSAHDFKKLVINKRKLSGQFQSLLKPKYQIDAQSGSATENKNRNRFSKIIPLDVSSPHLQCTSLLGGSGYINACFANSYFKKNAFILTQSPLPNTVEDFWRMVYDQKSTKIIMLNMLDSTDKTCNLYWPSGNCQYGSVLVECTDTVTKDLYVCREMVVKHQDDEQASVKLEHFQLLSWPEGKTAIHVIQFIEAVGFSEGPEPVVVHCIDGVGHSGVYATIHNEMQRFKDSEKVDIFKTVQSLRERNPHVFSTLTDFLFCYEALQAFVSKVA